MAIAASAVLESWYHAQLKETEEPQDPWQILLASVGLSYVDVALAQKILEDSLSQQQNDGSIPRFLDPTFGGVMIPIHPILAWMWYRQTKDKTAFLAWLRPLFPRLTAAQEYWYFHRDAQEEGLITLQNATETFLPTPGIWPVAGETESPQIQDAAWYAVFCWANECLIDLGKALKTDVSNIIEGQELTIYSLNDKLWDEEYGIYRSFDVTQNQSILSGSIGGLMQLAGGIPNQEQAEMMRQALESNFIQAQHCWLPTYSLNSPQTQTDQLFLGNVDPLVNWLMYYGLLRYDFVDLAERLRRSTLQLIKEYGFYPAYDALQKEVGNLGLGNGNYGPTAAIYLDLAAKRIVRSSIK
jgi:hypothetical protein